MMVMTQSCFSVCLGGFPDLQITNHHLDQPISLVPTFDDNNDLIWDHVKLDAKSDLVSQSVNHSVLVVELDWRDLNLNLS